MTKTMLEWNSVLAWRNPARTHRFIETLNWHGVWWRPRTSTFYCWSL